MLVVDQLSQPPTPPAPSPPARRWYSLPIWNRFTAVQLAVMGLASIAPLVILVALVAGALGLLHGEEVRDLALGAGENPGMIVFGAMFLATPVQRWTGRSQVRVRKYLGIVFFLLAFSNGAMFVWEAGIAQALSRPLLIAGTIALVLAMPLFATSSRASQRMLGMRRWRLLHRLTYVVAAALLAHVLLARDFGPGGLLILLGFAARTPPVQARLDAHSRNQLRG